MFRKILIANRGEIAARIAKTCREMGVVSVAVYSEADRRAAHVLAADEAAFIGPAESSESYLSVDRILAAAEAAGAEAVHPGYGFLAENPALAAACGERGLVFIGPPAGVIAVLGDKTAARRMMKEAGVPVIPGLMEAESRKEAFFRAADDIGYPVLVKAAGGGGGKGMRVVRSPEELDEALDAAASEARTAFGSEALYLEKHLPRCRHVEVQILADAHGNTVHLFERECSIQRRHQKIVEESPSPALDDDLRRRMCEAAVRAARAAGYVNAGTVEFLLDDEGNFYFLEVNTRIQVEHPVTEMLTGFDLVREQLRIAAGEPLGYQQDEIAARGHAIECRVYAEDPAAGFRPSPGRVLFAREPSGPGVRCDPGIYSGCDVPVHYDPIMAKVIVHAQDRPAAVDRMIAALKDYAILGVETPIGLMIRILDSAPFREGRTFTDFLDRHFADPGPPDGDETFALIGYVMDDLLPRERPAASARRHVSRISPWDTLGRWRIRPGRGEGH